MGLGTCHAIGKDQANLKCLLFIRELNPFFSLFFVGQESTKMCTALSKNRLSHDVLHLGSPLR